MNTLQYLDDAALTALLTQGNRLAFAAIYKRYATPLYRFARKKTGVKEDSEEMVHDVFEQLWKRHTHLQIDSLKHYLFHSVQYMVIRYFHNRGIKKRHVEHYKIFTEVYEAAHPDKTEVPVQERLLACLSGLPDRCREAMQMRILENLNNEEIAARMGINKRTVELYMTKALAHLRGQGERILG